MENTNDKLALHAILIKKPCNLEEAQATAQEFIKDRKKKFYRETKNYYRFRNIPKTHFMPKFYKTKKINKNVSIIIGKLKPESEHLEGSGMLDFFKKKANQVKQTVQNVASKVSNIFTPRLDSYNNTSRKTLEQYGNLPIKSLTICRTPIMKVLDKTLNFLSLGKFSELKKKYGFDELFHLQLVANVDNKNIVIEKNEVINVNTSFKNDSKTQTYQIPLNKTFTINEMLEKARNNVGDHLYFSYSAFTNNCQSYIKYLLEGEGLFTQQASDFLYQDIEELAKEMPQYVKTTANVLTHTGAVANKLMGKAKLTGGLRIATTGAQFILSYYKLPINKLKQYVKEILVERGITEREIEIILEKPKQDLVHYIFDNFNEEELKEISYFNKYNKKANNINFEKIYGLSKQPPEEILKAYEEDLGDIFEGKKSLMKGDNTIIKLEEHQKKFLQGFFIGNLRSSILFHGVGTGKTLTAISTARVYLNLYPKNNVIVITPPAVLYNFINSLVAYGIDPRDKRFKFMTYGQFYRSNIVAFNSLLIVDEAHNFRTEITSSLSVNPITGQAAIAYGPKNKMGVQLLNRGGKPAHKVILMTATPFINKPYDIENLVAIGEGTEPINEENFGQMASNKNTSYDYFKFKISKYVKEVNDKNFPERREKFVPIVVEATDALRAKAGQDNPFFIYSRQSSDGDNLKFNYVLDKIMENPNKKFVCYTAFQEYGVKELTSLFTKNNIEFSIISGKVSTLQKSDAITGYNSYNKRDYLGNRYRVLIITKAGAEGVSLIETRGIYILSGQWNTSLYEQIVARAIRFKSHINLPKDEQYVEVQKLFVCFKDEAKVLNKLNKGGKVNFHKIQKSILDLRVKIAKAKALKEGKTISKKDLLGAEKAKLTNVKADANFDFEKAQELTKGKNRTGYLKEELAFGKNKGSYVSQSLTQLEEKIPSTDYYLFILERSKQEVIDKFINYIAGIPNTEQTVYDLPFGKRMFNEVLKGKIDGKTMSKDIKDALENNVIKTIDLIDKSTDNKESELEKLRKHQIKISDIRHQRAFIDLGQEYFTPPEIVDKLIDFSGIKKHRFLEELNILEPSAGYGAIVAGLLECSIGENKKDKIKNGISIDMVEYSPDNRKELEKLVKLSPHYLTLTETPNFLNYIKNPVYDYIFMNPPFHLSKATNKTYVKDVYDFDFVKRAYAMLKEGGRIVAITGLSFKREEQRFQEAMQWYEDHNATIKIYEKVNWTGEKLKKGSEIKGVNIAFILIDKEEDDQKENNKLLEETHNLIKDEFRDKKEKVVNEEPKEEPKAEDAVSKAEDAASRRFKRRQEQARKEKEEARKEKERQFMLEMMDKEREKKEKEEEDFMSKLKKGDHKKKKVVF